jgi:hypothetical protein
LVPHFTGEVKTRLGSVDEELYEGILFADQLPMETIAEVLEHYNEYMRAEFLEWHIDFLKRRMEKMDIEREAQDLKAVEARSTCEECEEYDHVQGKPRLKQVRRFKIWFLFLRN